VPRNPQDSSNVFRFDSINLNLPGQATYCPSLPWVAKYRSDDNVPAADVFIYFDDCRTMGNSEQECWAATGGLGVYSIGLAYKMHHEKGVNHCRNQVLGLGLWYLHPARMSFCIFLRYGGRKPGPFSTGWMLRYSNMRQQISNCLKAIAAYWSMLAIPIRPWCHI
jgi:hypothetical protein